MIFFNQYFTPDFLGSRLYKSTVKVLAKFLWQSFGFSDCHEKKLTMNKRVLITYIISLKSAFQMRLLN